MKHNQAMIYDDQDGNSWMPWQAALAYVDWLGNPAGLEEFKQELLKKGITQQEIDEALALYRSCKDKK